MPVCLGFRALLVSCMLYLRFRCYVCVCVLVFSTNSHMKQHDSDFKRFVFVTGKHVVFGLLVQSVYVTGQ